MTLLQQRMCHLPAQLSLKLQVKKSVTTLHYQTEVQHNTIAEYTMGSKSLLFIINILLQIYYLYNSMGKI